MEKVNVGIIGGGLMGREMASAFARWCALTEVETQPQLVAVADVNPKVLSWFQRIPTAELLTEDYHELLVCPHVDVVYVAVPHHLHESVYTDVLKSGKDLFAEKPFGIDLESARRIRDTIDNNFVLCSSEFPFFPGAQFAFDYAKSGKLGRVLEVVSGFHHASDLNPSKKANWKRQSATCGEIGVLGDLGMHACHLPLRLGWVPSRVYAQLSKGFPTRPDGKGGQANCDTWDNALLNCWVENGDQNPFPLRLEMKRLAPGETNTWFFEAVGTTGGVRFSTKFPKTVDVFEIGDDGTQVWKRTDLGFGVPFKAVTGGIFEVGFPDIIQQMWAAFLYERAGQLGEKFGCATVDEAVMSQQIFAAGLRSQLNQTVESIA